ncbi:MAG: type II secretion system ATPase GspE [Methylococcales bacterium]|nr:type II secretion system ATPase GspE [Methylococcales bacterium]
MSSSSHQALLDYLIDQQKLAASEIRKLERLHSASVTETTPHLLIKLGLSSETDIADAFAQLTGLAKVSAEAYPLEAVLPESVSLKFLQQQHIVGLAQDDQVISVAMLDPTDSFALSSLQLATGQKIVPNVGVLSEIDAALEVQYGEGQSQMDKLLANMESENVGEEDLEHLKDMASEAPVIKMVNLILQKAIDNRASDIHIEPFEQKLKVRLRIDGVLQEIDSPPAASAAAVLSRVKIMAKLNIAERRLPQDGRIKVQMLGKELDLRVSTIPTLYGESVVIRLLDKETTVLDFKALGFSATQLARFNSILAKPHGIILITGPTGSGKSTTLYTALKQLNTTERKIITVEDPVEYQLEGINQIQAKPQIGLNFAAALRSIVRQDPDVIMIGEMRDLETARIAVQSALTGHLVLSTLHTNDAAGGVTRLQDMGLEEYLLSSTVNGILAQRLVRKLCPDCKTHEPVPETMAREMQLRRLQPEGELLWFHAQGCAKCHGLGYRGRMAIVEFLVMTDPIRKLIMTHAEAGDIQKLAIEQGMLRLYEDGLSKALAGSTTLDEVLRVTTEN